MAASSGAGGEPGGPFTAAGGPGADAGGMLGEVLLDPAVVNTAAVRACTTNI